MATSCTLSIRSSRRRAAGRRFLLGSLAAVALSLPLDYGIALYLSGRRPPLLPEGSDDVPGRDEPLTALDVLTPSRLTAVLVSHYVTEASSVESPRREGGLTFIEQPRVVPAGWSYDVRGLAIRPTRIRGDWSAEVGLDLSRSRFSRRSAVADGTVWSLFSIGFEAAADRHDPFTCGYWPAVSGSASGTAACGPRAMAVPPGTRYLSFRFIGRSGRVALSCSADQRPGVPLGTWDFGTAPLRKIAVGAFVFRPRAAPEGAWEAPGRDIYAVRSFRLTCADPEGCLVRVREEL